MAEKEQTHRLECERLALPKAIESDKRGQLLGWALGSLALICAVINTWLHGPWQVGVALVGLPVLGAVQSFVRGKAEQAKDVSESE